MEDLSVDFTQKQVAEVSSVNEQVLQFYRSLPFNTYSSTEKAALEMSRTNQIRAWYKDLDIILGSEAIQSALDVGCGGGWLTNSLAFHYEISTCGVDFNPSAIEIAQGVAQQLDLTSKFRVANLFDLSFLKEKFDLILSIGVLHHTDDPFGGIISISNLLSDAPEARLYIGLYHKFGRGPFLRLFSDLKENGASEDELYDVYRELHSNLDDETHLRSWFRDQVLHPHESQHTLRELSEFLNCNGMEIETTSINGFQPIDEIGELFELEKQLEQISYNRNVVERRYFPGFFTACIRKFGVER